jgi:hypothetical protein
MVPKQLVPNGAFLRANDLAPVYLMSHEAWLFCKPFVVASQSAEVLVT